MVAALLSIFLCLCDIDANNDYIRLYLRQDGTGQLVTGTVGYDATTRSVPVTWRRTNRIEIQVCRRGKVVETLIGRQGRYWGSSGIEYTHGCQTN